MAVRYASTGGDASLLAKSLQFEFSGRTAQNRFLKAATTERISSWDPSDKSRRRCGIPSKETIRLYETWGAGEYGVLVTGNIIVDADHMEAPGNMLLPTWAKPIPGDERFEAYRTLGGKAKAHGSLFLGQLNHPGRQTWAVLNPEPLSASEVRLEDTMGMHFAKPRAATAQDLVELVQSFTNAAEYLCKAGWDGVQIHVAHGYLLAQFLSKTTNLRTDNYGGSLQNRARLLIEIIASIRTKVPPSFVLSVKLNSVEFQDGGFSTEEAAELCSILEQQTRVDFVELSGGTYQSLAFEHKRESTRQREAFFIEFAESIAPRLCSTKVYVTGGFRTVGAMASALQAIDGVGLARVPCQEPYFCHQILSGQIKGAIQQRIDDADFGIANVAAGTLIGLIAKGYQPLDLSQKENMTAFLKDMEIWIERQQHDKGLAMFGYVDITSEKLQALPALQAPRNATAYVAA